jgi:carboxymethylenebutenolidase
VAFENGKMHHEHILWDQASALVQVGLLDPAGLPVVGIEAARKTRNPASVPSNLLLKRVNDDPLL